jgi:hypothetical protein
MEVSLLSNTQENTFDITENMRLKIRDGTLSSLLPIGPLIKGSSSLMVSIREFATSMLLNVSRLNEIERARLWHWRMAHPAHEVPVNSVP